jgi:hypothetical protein
MKRLVMAVVVLIAALGFQSTPAASPTLTQTAEPYDGGIVFALSPDGVRSARLVIENEWTGRQWVETPPQGADPVIDWSTDGLPPFAGLRYHWEGIQEDLEPFWTEPTVVEVGDFSQDWQRLDGEQVSVFWYGEPEVYGQRALEVAEAHLDRLTADLGGEVPARAHVVLYQRQSDYGTTGSRSGEAQARYGVTVQWPCPCGDDDYLFQVTIPHEITHLWLWPLRNNTPVWFQEGLAVWSEPHDHGEQSVLLSRIAPRDELFSWHEMQHRYYNDAESMRRWYAQAWGMVDYIDRRGDLREMLDYLRDQPHGEFEGAMRATSGINSAQLLQDWRSSVGAPQRVERGHVAPAISNSPRENNVDWLLVGLEVLALVLLQIWKRQGRTADR